jgi:hypothetical protein
LIGKQPRSYAPAERERRGHSQARHEQRRPADLEHLSDRGLEADLEQQDQDSHPREHFDVRVDLDGLQSREACQRQVSQKDSHEEFPENRRLAAPNGKIAAQLRREQDHDQGQRDRGDGIGMRNPTGEDDGNGAGR